jgi:hypothetical protein
MISELISFEKESEISLGELCFKDVILKHSLGKKAPAGAHFDIATLNMHTGKLQLCNYDVKRMSKSGSHPIKEHVDFDVRLICAESE